VSRKDGREKVVEDLKIILNIMKLLCAVTRGEYIIFTQRYGLVINLVTVLQITILAYKLLQAYRFCCKDPFQRAAAHSII